jgi:hypothetical protein
MNTGYIIKLETGQKLTFEVQNRKGVPPDQLHAYKGVPDWVKLEYKKCKICPLISSQIMYCPAAFELQDVIGQCSELVSYETVEITRESEEGSITTQTDLQKALFSVIGEKVFSSACPVMNTRQWTLDYYSILTTPENIFYRSLSSYLVRQFFIASKGGKADFQLECHIDYVEEAVYVFDRLLQRFRDVSREDASNNAVVRLVMMAQLLKIKRGKWMQDLADKIGV